MSNKTYADKCLERAEKVTEGSWTYKNFHVVSKLYDIADVESHEDGKFIASARTDVPELAKRLKIALDHIEEVSWLLIRETHMDATGEQGLDLIKELEAPLVKK